MIFRTLDGDFLDINSSDYSRNEDYYETIMSSVFGIKPPVVGIRDDINQLDLIYNIAMSNNVRQSKL